MDRSSLVSLMARPLTLMLGMFVTLSVAAQPPGRGRHDETFAKDRADFHFLLQNRDSITREVKELENGVETLTESSNPKVAARIRRHVEAMHQRLKQGRPIHRRDPLFDAVFRNAEKVHMKIKPTEKGVLVRETSEDPHTARLIKAHAKVVSLFIKNGHTEVRRNHPVPERDN